MLYFGINGEIAVFTPSEPLSTTLNVVLCPLVILVQVCAEVEVIVIVASNREMISINGPTLYQLTNYINRYVGADYDQIHIEMLVGKRDTVDDEVDGQDEQGKIGRQNYNHLAPSSETEIEVSCTNLVS